METRELVSGAASGDRDAWEQIVERYSRLVWNVARSYRLDEVDAGDVYQTTWMRLVEHIDRLRNPDALAGWLAATARNECLRVLRHQARLIPTEEDRMPEDSVPSALDAELLTSERDAALWRAFAKLPTRCQALLRMLAADPPPSYEDVSAALGMPIGSIGPTRGRCLQTLRRAAATARITA